VQNQTLRLARHSSSTAASTSRGFGVIGQLDRSHVDEAAPGSSEPMEPAQTLPDPDSPAATGRRPEHLIGESGHGSLVT
jgi:hypothetical protein